MQNWGNFFDQAPTSEAGVPVAAMRAAVRPASKVFQTNAQIRPSTMMPPHPIPRMEIPPPPELPKPGEPTNELGDIAKTVAGVIDPESEKKSDGFGDRMSAIDEQLAAMKAERTKLLEGITGKSNTSGTGNFPNLPGGTVEGVFGNMIQQESGNTHFRNGQPITSSAGARGIAQIMPSTGPIAAQLAGLPWNSELFNRGQTGDPAKDAEARDYNLALGRAYYDEQLKTFGSPALAAAAYNAGPGNVSKALAAAKETGRSFLEFLPKETQNYVMVVTRPTEKKAEGGRIRYLRSLVGT